MCQKAAQTAAGLMAAIEPTLKNLLSFTGLASTPAGEAVMAAYDAAMAALKNWTSGTPAQEAIEVIDAFESAFYLLPLPAPVNLLVNIILAGVAAVIGLLTANSPAPPASATEPATATPEETQAMHQLRVAEQTSAKVQQLVPGFKRSIWHSPAHQYNDAWNNAVDEAKLPATLKV